MHAAVSATDRLWRIKCEYNTRNKYGSCLYLLPVFFTQTSDDRSDKHQIMMISTAVAFPVGAALAAPVRSCLSVVDVIQEGKIRYLNGLLQWGSSTLRLTGVGSTLMGRGGAVNASANAATGLYSFNDASSLRRAAEYGESKT